MPSLISALKHDHQVVDELLQRAKACSDQALATRRALFAKIHDALQTHMAFEEEHVYPLLRDASQTGKKMTLEAYEEHAQIKTLLEELSGLDAADARWKAKITVLAEDMEHHVQEEERKDGLFDHLRHAVDEETLSSLAEDFAARKHEPGTVAEG